MSSSSDYQKFINTYHFCCKSANTFGQTKTMQIVPAAKFQQVSNLIPQKF
ncbi:MAG: hypothetical protein V7K56_02275 [Nostoc sp.]